MQNNEFFAMYKAKNFENDNLNKRIDLNKIT